MKALLAVAAALSGGPLDVESRVPKWLAPGAQLVVRGTTQPDVEVKLAEGDGPVTSSTSGTDGRFVLRATFTTRGRKRLILVAGDVRVSLGTLVVRPLRLAAVGDVTFGGAVNQAIASHGAAYPWQHVGRALRTADLATANLETAVSTRGARVADKEFHFRGSPAALLAARRNAGLDVVTVANNHTLDFGRVAFLDTLGLARRYGIATVGGGANLAAARRAVLLERGGLRVAFLGYSDVRPDGFTAGPATAGTAPAAQGFIQGDVRRARRSADVVVVWFHWGEELARAADGRQRAFASAALNAGAHVVLGAHAHVLQPVVRPARGLLVAWGLGNFVFSPNSPGTDRTGILSVDLGADGVLAHRLQPARIVGVQPRLRR